MLLTISLQNRGQRDTDRRIRIRRSVPTPRRRRLLLKSMGHTGSGALRILAEAITDRNRTGIPGTPGRDGIGLLFMAFPLERSSDGSSSCSYCLCFSGCFCSFDNNDDEMKAADMHSVRIGSFLRKKKNKDGLFGKKDMYYR